MQAPISAFLVHGMGRSPLSMQILAWRLRQAGFRTHCFGYVAAFERFASCRERLLRQIHRHAGVAPFLLAGHSLGSVLIRACLPDLPRPPLACAFMAPPTVASKAARFFRRNALYRLGTGEIGQRLGEPDFMAALPVPDVPTTIYAGIAGPRGRWSPFGNEDNDGVLGWSEVQLPGARILRIDAMHTFIMNSRIVTADLISTCRQLAGQSA